MPACSCKNTYGKSEAVYVLATIQRRRATGTFKDYCQAIRAYWCDMHGGWHLTKHQLTRRPNDTDILPGDY